jgi:hypothetical protein
MRLAAKKPSRERYLPWSSWKATLKLSQFDKGGRRQSRRWSHPGGFAVCSRTLTLLFDAFVLTAQGAYQF